MTDLETRIRDDLARRAEGVQPSAALDTRVERLVSAPARSRRPPYRLVAAAIVAVVLLVAGAIGLISSSRDTGEDVVTTDPPTEASWRELPPPPLDPNAGFSAVVATDDKVIVFGSALPGEEPVGGAALDLETDTWRTIAPSPLGDDDAPGQAVWTGEHVLLVRGTHLTRGEPGPALLAYNPARNAWRVPPVPGAVAAALRGSVAPPLAHWTDGGLVLRLFSDGAVWRYQPADDWWDMIVSFPSPGGNAVAVGSMLFRSATFAREPESGETPNAQALEGPVVLEHRVDQFDLSSGERSSLASPIALDDDAAYSVDLAVTDEHLVLWSTDAAWVRPIDGSDQWRQVRAGPQGLGDFPVAAGSSILFFGQVGDTRQPLDVLRFYDPLSGEVEEVRGFPVRGRGERTVVWTGEEAVLVHLGGFPDDWTWTVLAFTPPG
jgi:hypothetical protein